MTVAAADGAPAPSAFVEADNRALAVAVFLEGLAHDDGGWGAVCETCEQMTVERVTVFRADEGEALAVRTVWQPVRE